MGDIISYIKSFGLINLFFVVLTLMNIMGLGHWFGYITIALIILKKDLLKSGLDSFFLMILIFSLTYSLFYLLNPWKGYQYFLIYLLSPPGFYLWGKLIVIKGSDHKQVFTILIVLGILYSLPSLVSVLLNIKEGGFAQADRNIPMFWGGAPVNATGMAGFLMFNMCIPALLIPGHRLLSKSATFVLIVIFVLSLASVLRLGSRTQLGIFLLSLIFSIVYVGPKLTLKQNLAVFGIMAVAVFAIMRNVSFNLDSDLFTSFAGRMKNNGAEDLAGGGGRVELWAKSLEFMQRYPFGWDLDAFGYSHNLWFDTFRTAGFIAFIILIFLFLKIFFLLLKILKSKVIAISNRVQFLLFLIAFISIFMVEPGIDGTLSLFLFFCLFVGIMSQFYSSYSQIK